MSNSISHADKTAVFAFCLTSRATIACVILCVLFTIPGEHVIAQTQTVQPCVVAKPCTGEVSPSKPVSKRVRSTAAGARPAKKRVAPPQKPSPALQQPGAGRVSGTFVDQSIPDDPAVEKMLEPYSGKVRALEVVIGRLEGDLRKGPIGAGNLGNFVADGIRSQASVRLGRPILIAVTNSGGLRKNTIAGGELRAADIFELLPFENALIEIDLTGEQLLRLLSIVTSARDAQSGARIKYRTNPEGSPEVLSAVLLDQNKGEVTIDPKATYTIVTIDYLFKLASGNYAILQQGKNVKPLGVTIRDAIMDYVKAETAAGRSIKATLDGRFVSVDPQ